VSSEESLKEIFSEENVRRDVQSMSKEEMIDELIKWRTSAPNILQNCHELLEYRSIAESPSILEAKINKLVETFQGTIILKDQQIYQLAQALQRIKEDPLGIDAKLANNTSSTKSTKVH